MKSLFSTLLPFFVLSSALFSSPSFLHSVFAYDQGGRYDYGAELARKNMGNKEGGGNMLVLGGVSAVAGFGLSQIWIRWGHRSSRRRHDKELEKILNNHDKDKKKLIQAYTQQKHEYQYMLSQAEMVIQQLHDRLSSSDVDESKRKYAEFKLPDENNDDVITRAEFNKYLQNYLVMHPEMSEADYPSFDDFDTDGNGKVAFMEWKKFMTQLQEDEENNAGNRVKR